MQGEILLQGIVGSRAYGFAHENSDTDRLGLYAAPTNMFHGLGQPQESYVTTKPDLTLHEARKWCRLVLKCNPTAMELVWLNGYETVHPLGLELITIRRSFLSAKAVRNAYLGYATDQLAKMKQARNKMDSREDPADIANRRLKHARHIVRLLVQAQGLHQDGELVIRLHDPDWVLGMSEYLVKSPTLGDDLLKATGEIFDKPGVLPQEPNTVEVEAWLHRVRREFL
jgi:predicted nucleotidyltransferase